MQLHDAKLLIHGPETGRTFALVLSQKELQSGWRSTRYEVLEIVADGDTTTLEKHNVWWHDSDTARAYCEAIARQPRRPERVAEHEACPSCGEREIDNLVWVDDEHVRCMSCHTLYAPLAAPALSNGRGS